MTLVDRRNDRTPVHKGAAHNSNSRCQHCPRTDPFLRARACTRAREIIEEFRLIPPCPGWLAGMRRSRRVNVCFWGQSGHRVVALQCRLLTQSGHWPGKIMLTDSALCQSGWLHFPQADGCPTHNALDLLGFADCRVMRTWRAFPLFAGRPWALIFSSVE